MENGFRELLRPVRRRMIAAHCLTTGSVGLLIGAGMACLLGLVGLLPGVTIAPAWPVALLVAGLVAGILVSLLRSATLRGAANAVDQRFNLKDRTLSAIEFMGRKESGAVFALQLADAREHLRGRDLRQAARMRVPRSVPFSLGLLVAALVLAVWPAGDSANEVRAAGPFAAALEIAALQDKRIEELEKKIEEEKNPEVKEQLQELLKVQEALAEALRQPAVDQREALAKLSEVEAELAKRLGELDTALMSAKLQELGKALAAAKAFKGLAADLEAGKFSEAANKLDGMEMPKLDSTEMKALDAELAKAAQSMAEEGLDELAQLVEGLADSLEATDVEGFCEACEGLGEALEGQCLRAGLCKGLKGELGFLAECKAGLCAGNKNSLTKGQTNQESKSPRNSWGQKTHGDINGPRTRIQSTRDVVKVKGAMGAGPSEFERTQSKEGEGKTSRSYKEVYQEYRKISEAVLESEPIPLGQRRTIRRYFELIRPRTGEGRSGK